MQATRAVLVGAFAMLAAACDPGGHDARIDGTDARGHTGATAATIAANERAVAGLALDDPRDFEDASRGLVASEPQVEIETDELGRIWSTHDYAFMEGAAPESVHASLWRQAKLNNLHGLFEVAPGIYQVRGYDLSNMTLVAGKTGWIVIDPLTARETAAAAWALVGKALGDKPVAAVIFSHSHIDHFGGVDALLPAIPDRRALRVVAPRGFTEEATSENVLAGIAMGRRAVYMYGFKLARGPRGHVDTGLGKSPASGTIGFMEPTDLVDRTVQELTIDGVDFRFQYVPDSEAPAELTFYLPHAKAFFTAEIASHVMHNLYTPRGAKVRDALRWSNYVDEAIRLFDQAEVAFGAHSWPVWGADRVREYLESQRDTYRYIHDQTLRLANAGLTPREIAETIELPESLSRAFSSRGYYGTTSHNSKAVYQFYFGWYDGNPANLNPLPPEDLATHYVAAIGGRDRVLEVARTAIADGDYRWAATLLDHAVFAEPGDVEAKTLLAKVYDQLGYQSESAPWRDIYLTGAFELRHGAQGSALRIESTTNLLLHMPVARFFDSMASRLDGPAAEGKSTRINFVFTDLGESYVVWLQNAVLHHRAAEPDPDADATVKLTRDFLVRLATRQVGLREMIFSDDLAVEGSRLALLSFFSLLDNPRGDFPIVTP
jgi:alkyl sulfatase BDS1-like metallo-beta-lactamase superfamily hydrolase